MPYHIVCYIYRQATKNGVVQTQLQLQIQIHLDTRVEMPRQPNLVTHKSKKKKKNQTKRAETTAYFGLKIFFKDFSPHFSQLHAYI